MESIEKEIKSLCEKKFAFDQFKEELLFTYTREFCTI